MWKASFTSVLAVKKKSPLREHAHRTLDDLLKSGVTIGVVDSSSLEGNFRNAKSGVFQEAWQKMKDNPRCFVEDRTEGLSRMFDDEDFSFFDSLISMAATPEYQSCQVTPIDQRYYRLSN